MGCASLRPALGPTSSPGTCSSSLEDLEACHDAANSGPERVLEPQEVHPVVLEFYFVMGGERDKPFVPNLTFGEVGKLTWPSRGVTSDTGNTDEVYVKFIPTETAKIQQKAALGPHRLSNRCHIASSARNFSPGAASRFVVLGEDFGPQDLEAIQLSLGPLSGKYHQWCLDHIELRNLRRPRLRWFFRPQSEHGAAHSRPTVRLLLSEQLGASTEEVSLHSNELGEFQHSTSPTKRRSTAAPPTGSGWLAAPPTGSQPSNSRDTTSMLGPLLGFNGSTGTRWKVTVLLVTGQGEGPVVGLRWCIQGGAEHSVPGTRRKIAAGRYALGWRFAVPRGAYDTWAEYSIDGIPGTGAFGGDVWRFSVPGLNSMPNMAMCSGNGHGLMAGLDRTMCEHDSAAALWRAMWEQHERKALQLLLMGGDQVYCNAIWCIPPFKQWVDQFGENSLDNIGDQKEVATPWSDEMERNAQLFYLDMYAAAFGSNQHVRAVLGSVPTFGMWDRHDIFEAWGNYPAELQACPTVQGIFAVAKSCFELFQLRLLNDDWQQDFVRDYKVMKSWPKEGQPMEYHGKSILDPLVPATQLRNNWSFVMEVEPICFVVLDHRSERTLHSCASDETWVALEKRLMQVPAGRHEHFFFLFSVPLLHVDSSSVDGVSGVKRRFRSHCPSQAGDFSDHWTHPRLREERLRAIQLMQRIAQRKQVRCTILSGNVGVGSCGMIDCTDLDAEFNTGLLQQLTTSGIAHSKGSTSLSEDALLRQRYEWEDKVGIQSRGESLEKSDSRQRWTKFLCDRNFLVVNGRRTFSGYCLRAQWYADELANDGASLQHIPYFKTVFPVQLRALTKEVAENPEALERPGGQTAQLLQSGLERKLAASMAYSQPAATNASHAVPASSSNHCVAITVVFLLVATGAGVLYFTDLGLPDLGSPIVIGGAVVAICMIVVGAVIVSRACAAGKKNGEVEPKSQDNEFLESDEQDVSVTSKPLKSCLHEGRGPRIAARVSFEGDPVNSEPNPEPPLENASENSKLAPILHSAEADTLDPLLRTSPKGQSTGSHPVALHVGEQVKGKERKSKAHDSIQQEAWSLAVQGALWADPFGCCAVANANRRSLEEVRRHPIAGTIMRALGLGAVLCSRQRELRPQDHVIVDPVLDAIKGVIDQQMVSHLRGDGSTGGTYNSLAELRGRSARTNPALVAEQSSRSPVGGRMQVHRSIPADRSPRDRSPGNGSSPSRHGYGYSPATPAARERWEKAQGTVRKGQRVVGALEGHELEYGPSEYGASRVRDDLDDYITQRSRSPEHVGRAMQNEYEDRSAYSNKPQRPQNNRRMYNDRWDQTGRPADSPGNRPQNRGRGRGAPPRRNSGRNGWQN